MRLASSNTNWFKIEELLDFWFNLGLSRGSSLPFDSSLISKKDALVAGAIFKRGVKQIYDTHSQTIISLSTHVFEKEGRIQTPHFNFCSDIETLIEAFRDLLENAVFICDRNVLKLHPKIALELSKSRTPILPLNCQEKEKTLPTIISLLNAIPKNTEHLIAIGGGLCCDVAGFTGALAGTKIHYVPTTLLAIVDAGLGGKTGVNHARAGKNQIGCFAQIESLSVVNELISTQTTTLIRQGLAEILKHSFLFGSFELWYPQLVSLLHATSHAAVQKPEIISLIQDNLAFKNSIVLADPFEKDLRAMLNFGHTTAHLIEGISAIAPNSHHIHKPLISHGVSVAIGLLCFARAGLAHHVPSKFNFILEDLIAREDVNLPLFKLSDIHDFARNILLQDKKNTPNQHNHITCITPTYGCLSTIPDEEQKLKFKRSQSAEIQVDDLLDILQRVGLFL